MKNILRQQAITFLKSFQDNPQKKLRENKLLTDFMASPSYQEAQVLGVFLPTPFEFDLTPLIQQAWLDGKKIVAPVAAHHQMTFYEYQATTPVNRSAFGVLEPMKERPVAIDEIDLLVVPGLIFNKDGYRIGFGGGYYDRFLVQFTGETVSFLFKEQVGDFTPASFDIAVNKLWIN